MVLFLLIGALNSLTGENRVIVPFLACGDLSGFDSDMAYPVQVWVFYSFMPILPLLCILFCGCGDLWFINATLISPLPILSLYSTSNCPRSLWSLSAVPQGKEGSPYQPLAPTQSPINPPYKTACELKKGSSQPKPLTDTHKPCS